MPHVLAQDLRDAVLQAAVSGGLTEKEAGDTNITEYYKSLIDNKASNVASKKWKKEFPVERIDNSEFEYDLGENWIWCYLGDICAIRGGKRVPVGRKLSDKATSQKYIRVADMKDHSVLLDGIKYLPDDLVDRLSLYTISKDDLYITVAGTIGDVGIIPDELDGANLTENADKIVFEKINKRWLLICLLSNGVQKQIKAATTQVGQPKLAIKRIQSLYIPLCPIEEQARIVAKVDELMAKIDEYEKIEKELTELQKAFPGNMKDAILQAAMQGKLTEQLESDGDVCELIASINKIREQGVKDKAIRKAKGISTFTEDDIPYDVPENWGWMRFGSLVANCDGDRKPVSKELRVRSAGGIYPYYGATGAIDKVDDYLFDGEYLMIGEDGGNFFVNRDNSFIAKGKFWANNHVHVVKPIEMNIKYLKGFLDSCNLPLMGLINGIAVPKLNQENLNSIMVPIPPIEEQQRIVDKLDQLLPLCEQLEKMAA